MLEQPHHYTDAKGKKQKLVIRLDTIEGILSDKISAAKNLQALSGIAKFARNGKSAAARTTRFEPSATNEHVRRRPSVNWGADQEVR
ncbi:hypothetical protein GCK32_005286 [Trichostrongylus colubriformis]|uniref:Uncharacterized protein n=1 Tax=Trichostrongylus colubriformis TaxID=6319 RepID=A0AAN8ITU1_TRICO